jgi:hypothetical protein
MQRTAIAGGILARLVCGMTTAALSSDGFVPLQMGSLAEE